MTNIKPKSCTSTSVFLLGKLYQSPVSFYYLMVAVSAATLTQRLWREQPLYVCLPWRRCDVGAGVCQAVCIVAYGEPVTSSRPVYLKRPMHSHSSNDDMSNSDSSHIMQRRLRSAPRRLICDDTHEQDRQALSMLSSKTKMSERPRSCESAKAG